MSYHELTAAIDPIEPDEGEGLFHAIIQSFRSLPDPNNVGWGTLADMVAECKSKWGNWYDGFVAREVFLRREEQWKGNGQVSSRYLLQTVTELCNALESLNRWAGALGEAPASLQSLDLGGEVVIKDAHPKSTRTTTTLEGAREEAVKRIFTVACRLADCQRSNNFMEQGQAMSEKDLKELEKRTEDAVVEELKGNRCLRFLKKSPGHDDAKDWEKYLQTLRPQPVSEAVEAVKKEETRQRSQKPQSDTTGSTSARTNRAQQPGSTSALYGGQAAPPS